MRLISAMSMAIVVSIAAAGSVLGQETAHIQLAAALGGFAMAQDTDNPDTAIERAFRTTLNREPSSTERRRYRVLMQQNE